MGFVVIASYRADEIENLEDVYAKSRSQGLVRGKAPDYVGNIWSIFWLLRCLFQESRSSSDAHYAGFASVFEKYDLILDQLHRRLLTTRNSKSWSSSYIFGWSLTTPVNLAWASWYLHSSRLWTVCQLVCNWLEIILMKKRFIKWQLLLKHNDRLPQAKPIFGVKNKWTLNDYWTGSPSLN